VSHHLVAMREVVFTFPDGRRALDGVSFEIHHGEAVALVGANGAGKSTLLHLLVGIRLPTSGAIRVGDWPVTSATLSEIRRRAGLVFQDPDDQLFLPTVAEDVAFGPLNQKLPEEEVATRVREALALVGAEHLAERPPHRLSGGERRAVAIATVLAQHPDILLLDEPSAGLDPATRRRVIRWLRAFEHTRIVATHDLDLALDVCPRTIVLGEGRVLADGPSRELYRDGALLARAQLEPPLRWQDDEVAPVTAGQTAETR
jgi:cobalt/nickel transport system ATP-binding protein